MLKRLNIVSLLIVISILITSHLSLVGCGVTTRVSDSGRASVSDIEIPLNIKEQLEQQKKDEENEAYIQEFLEGLYEEGFISEEMKNSSQKRVLLSGMTVIGDAIPAKSYRTLAEGEEAYGKYLGLHNHVSDGTFDWELVQVVIIDEKILQGTYESPLNTNFNMKMTYPEKGASLIDLISVYNSCERYDDFELNDCKGKLGYSERLGRYETAFFISKNEKAYSIHNASGFTESEIMTILNELTYNLTIMRDWND